MKINRPKIIAVDFDGTIVENRFPEIGNMYDKVVDRMWEEKKAGSEIIIWTCRCGQYVKEMEKFLVKNDIPFDYINENVDWLNFETSRKIYADEYWDDRAKCFCAGEKRDGFVEV